MDRVIKYQIQSFLISIILIPIFLFFYCYTNQKNIKKEQVKFVFITQKPIIQKSQILFERSEVVLYKPLIYIRINNEMPEIKESIEKVLTALIEVQELVKK